MVNSNGKSRREIFMQHFPRATIATRKKFYIEFSTSSAGSVPDNTGIVFFRAFLLHRLNPHPQESISIRPKYWAKAFLQKDIESVARELCSEVFTQDELNARNQGGVLSFVKLSVISQLSKWMMKKDRDPWSFDASKPVPWTTTEEQDKLNNVFATFTTINPSETEVLPDPGTLVTPDEYLSAMNLLNLDGTISQEKVKRSDANFVRIMEDYDYRIIFKAVIECGKINPMFSLGNQAQTAHELSKITIPELTDVFVDAVQFSKQRWAKAFMARDVKLIAEILFRKHWKIDFVDLGIPFKSVEDFCPVKWLAILRAVAYIKANIEEEKPISFEFDSNNDDHNRFLSLDEMCAIEAYLNVKYHFENYSTEQYINNNNNLRSRLIQASNGNIFRPDVVEDNASEPMDTQSQPMISSNIVPNSYLPDVVNNSIPTAIVVGVSNVQLSAENDFNAREVPFVSIPSPTFKISQPNSPSISENEQILYPKYDQVGNIIINPQCILKKQSWIQAISKLTAGLKLVQVGKFLFQEVFTDEEIRTQQISTRNGRTAFSCYKVDGIYDALAIIKTIHDKNINVIDAFDDKGIVVKKWSSAERDHLKTKIFVEYRRYLLGKTTL